MITQSTEQEYIHLRQYDVITRYENPNIYNKFDAMIYDGIKKFPKKEVQQILLDVFKKDVISIGMGSKDFDDYGDIVFKPPKDLVGIVVNTHSNDIDILTGDVSNSFDIVMIVYFLYIKVLIVSNISKIIKDDDFIQNCQKYTKYLFYKILKLNGSTEVQKRLIDELINFFFRKFILDENARQIITRISDKETYSFFKDNIEILEKYSKFSEIFRAFYDLKIITNENPNQILMRFINSVGAIQLSLLVLHGLNGFVAAVVSSQYSSSKFKGLYIDPKLQSYIEEKILKYHKDQSFGKI